VYLSASTFSAPYLHQFFVVLQIVLNLVLIGTNFHYNHRRAQDFFHQGQIKFYEEFTGGEGRTIFIRATPHPPLI
jgi:hypothetical protein